MCAHRYNVYSLVISVHLYTKWAISIGETCAIFFRKTLGSPPVVIIVSHTSPNRSAHLIHRSRLLDACSTAFRSSTCLTCCRKTLSPRQRSAALTRSHLSPINDGNYFAAVVLCPSCSLHREIPSRLPLFSAPVFSGTITHPALRISRILRRCSFHAHCAHRDHLMLAKRCRSF